VTRKLLLEVLGLDNLKYISDLSFLSPPKFLLHMHGCVVGMGVMVYMCMYDLVRYVVNYV